MLLAAAEAIGDCAEPGALVPGSLDPAVHAAVASAVSVLTRSSKLPSVGIFSGGLTSTRCRPSGLRWTKAATRRPKRSRRMLPVRAAMGMAPRLSSRITRRPPGSLGGRHLLVDNR